MGNTVLDSTGLDSTINEHGIKVPFMLYSGQLAYVNKC